MCELFYAKQKCVNCLCETEMCELFCVKWEDVNFRNYRPILLITSDKILYHISYVPLRHKNVLGTNKVLCPRCVNWNGGDLCQFRALINS